MHLLGTPDFTQGTSDGATLVNTAASGPIREVDFSLIPTDRFFSLHVLLNDEIVVFLSGNAPGRQGPAPHFHSADQYFWLLEGQLMLTLGTETIHMEAGDVAHIPAGVPHKHVNPSKDQRELHLEILAPGVRLGEPFMVFVAPEDSWEGSGQVAKVADARGTVRTHGQTELRVLSDPSGSLPALLTQSRNLAMWQAHVPAGGGMNPTTHLHRFHQIYYVTSGTLGVEIGLDTYEVGAHTLVVIPPGTPHRNWTVGDTPETHIQINVPPPASPREENAWDIPVQLTEAGVR